MRGKLTFNKDGFFLSGKPFYLASGDVQYFRIHPTAWSRHLALAKDFGLTCIQTYMPWNLHEPEKGVFNFSGIADIEAFLDMAASFGLKVLLRPAPYICSECEFGGLPAWLLFEQGLQIRCSEERYLNHVKDYYKALVPRLLPHLSTNGGPIIMVALENEYGGSGYDKVYMQFLADTLTSLGVDVPFYTTDNNENMLQMGSLPDILCGANFRSLPGQGNRFADYIDGHFPEFPFFVGELWSGRSIHWGEPYHKRPVEETAASYEECLKRGFVNFYMFSGGTNFGFFSGAVRGRSFSPKPDTPIRFLPHTTSYDEDALVTEAGLPTEKYYRCREILDAHLGRPVRKDRTLPFPYETQSLNISLTESARLFDHLDVLTASKAESVTPLTFEDMRLQSGFMLYSTDIVGWEAPASGYLRLEGIHDRATVYDGEQFIGMHMRDRNSNAFSLDVANRTAHLNVLVEDVARINGGKEIDNDKKGLTRYVTFAEAKLYHWTMRALPMDDLSKLTYKEGTKVADNDPAFFRGTFSAKAGVDTYLDMRSWGRGFVRINGFSLGCFWQIGPQYTLYVPGGLLKDTDNVIEIFDVSHTGDASSITTLNEPILEGDATVE